MVRDKTEEFIQIFNSFIPEDLRRSKEDIERNLKSALNAAFSRMNLVTREEYEIQTELLARTRALVVELEQKVASLEQQSADRQNIREGE